MGVSSVELRVLYCGGALLFGKPVVTVCFSAAVSLFFKVAGFCAF